MRHHVLAAIAIAALGACTSEPVPVPRPPIAAAQPPAPAAPAPTFETLRAALPAFDVRAAGGTAPAREVSVLRDFTFAADDSLLTRDQITRLAPLQAYLRANPGIAVRVEASGDGPAAAEQDAALGRDRAQAIVRALLTDTRVSNTISALPAAASHRRGGATITFIMP